MKPEPRKKPGRKKKSGQKKTPKPKIKRFICEICDKKFIEKASYQLHVQTHSNEYPYQCEICDERFKVKKYVSRHVKRKHTAPTKNKCSICEKTFHFPSDLRDHMRVHTGEKPNKCKVCGKAFNSTYCLQIHMHIHTGEKPFKCVFCAYACRDNSTLRRHQQRHLGITQYFSCNICDKTCSKKKDLERHIDEIHFGIDVRIFECHSCEKAFKTNAALNSHIRTVHEKLYRVKCDLCGQEINRNNLKVHLRTHIDVRPYKCTYKRCDKRFKEKLALQKHYRIHYPSKQFACDLCGRKFTRTTRLKAHAKDHLAVGNNAQCAYCMEVFKNKIAVGLHISKYHLKNSKQYICDICEIVLYSRRLFKLHLDYGHGLENDLKCKVCIKDFKGNFDLRDHYLNEHRVHYVLLDRKMNLLQNDINNIMKQEIIDDSSQDSNLDFVYEIEISKREHFEEILTQNIKPITIELNNTQLDNTQLNNTQLGYQQLNSVQDDNALVKNTQLDIQQFNNTQLGYQKLNSVQDDNALVKDTQLNIQQLNNTQFHTTDNLNTQFESTELDNTLTQNTQQINTIDNTEHKKRQLKNTKRNKTNLNNIELNNTQLNNTELNNTQPNNVELNNVEPDPYIRYSKKVLSEDVSRMISELDNSTEEDVLDNLFVAHVVKHKKENKMVLPKKTVNERDIGKVEKTIEQLLNSMRMKKELQLIEDVRLSYNKRILEKQMRSESKEPKSLIKYYKNPNKNNNPIIADEVIDIEDVINTNDDETAVIIGNDCNNTKNSNNSKSEEHLENIANDEQETVNNSTNEQGNDNLENTNKNNEITTTITKENTPNEESIDNNEQANTSNNRNTRNRGKNNNKFVNDDLDSEEEIENNNENSKDSDFEMEETGNKNNKIHFNAHQCHVCFKLFKTKTELKHHCTIHFDLCSEKMLKKCPFCGYVTNLNILGHIKRIHDIKIQIPYGRIKEKPLESGSRFVYEIEKDLNLEVIPSISNLNKIASVKIDKKNRDDKNTFIGKTKLVKKGSEWIIAKEAIKINNDNLLPEFSEEEIRKTKIFPKDNIDRLRILSVLAKKKGIVFFYPCEFCEKVCRNLSALRLHNRKHETNPKPFKPKVWKNRIVKKKNPKNNNNAYKNMARNENNNVQKTYISTSIPKGRHTLVRVKESSAIINKNDDTNKNSKNKVENRFVKPNPVKGKHKCDKRLIEFYENNIKGKNIEFWQFLKIFNKMTRDNVNNFEDLENSKDFGIHTEFKNQNSSNNTHNNTNILGNGVNSTDIDTNKSVLTDKTQFSIKTKNRNTHNNKDKRNRVNNKIINTITNRSNSKRNTRIVLLSRNEMLLRKKLKNELRKRLETKI